MPSTISYLSSKKILVIFDAVYNKTVIFMTTLAAPLTKKYPDNSLEKKSYDIADRFKDNLPIMNDRNRLGFNIYRYLKGEGDTPEVIVKTARFTLNGITKEELAKKLNEEIEKVKEELKTV